MEWKRKYRSWIFLAVGVVVTVVAFYLTLPTKAQLQEITTGKVTRLEIYHKEYIQVVLGNPDVYVLLRLDFNLNQTYLYNEPYATSETYDSWNDITPTSTPFLFWNSNSFPSTLNGGAISNSFAADSLPIFISGSNSVKKGSEIFYFGIHKLRLPVVYGTPDPYYLSSITNRIQHDGVLGLGRGSSFWKSWQTVTITSGNIVFGSYDEREANLLDTNTFTWFLSSNPMSETPDIHNLEKFPCYADDKQYSCSFDFSKDSTILPPELYIKPKTIIKWPQTGKKNCINSVGMILDGANGANPTPNFNTDDMFTTICSYVPEQPSNFTLIISQREHLSRKVVPNKEAAAIGSLMTEINTQTNDHIILGRTFMLQQLVVFWDVLQNRFLLHKRYRYYNEIYQVTPLSKIPLDPSILVHASKGNETKTAVENFHIRHNPGTFEFNDGDADDISSLNFYFALALANIYILWAICVNNNIKYRDEHVRLIVYLLHALGLLFGLSAIVYNIEGLNALKIFIHHIHNFYLHSKTKTFTTPENGYGLAVQVVKNTNSLPIHPSKIWFWTFVLTLVITWIWNAVFFFIGVYYTLCCHFGVQNRFRCKLENHKHLKHQKQNQMVIKNIAASSFPQPFGIKGYSLTQRHNNNITKEKEEMTEIAENVAPAAAPVTQAMPTMLLDTSETKVRTLEFISHWYNNGAVGLLHRAIFEYNVISTLWLCFIEYRDMFHVLIVFIIYLFLILDQMIFFVQTFTRGTDYVLVHFILVAITTVFFVIFNVVPYIEILFPIPIGYVYIVFSTLLLFCVIPAVVVSLQMETTYIQVVLEKYLIKNHRKLPPLNTPPPKSSPEKVSPINPSTLLLPILLSERNPNSAQMASSTPSQLRTIHSAKIKSSLNKRLFQG